MSYDGYGNIHTKNGKAYTYGNSVWNDLLTSYGGQAISYDAQGNPTSYLGHTLTWEKGRQLKSFDSNAYTYNASGIRMTKTVGGVKHTYTLDGTKIIREVWGSNTLFPLYGVDDSVCGINYNGNYYYFAKNLQGDIIAIVDKDAKTVARYSYDAWGVPTVVSDSSGRSIATVNPFRYRGYYYDAEIGMYYLQSRYYNPVVGRFINVDDIEALEYLDTLIDLNLFAYAVNCPVLLTDDCGEGWLQNKLKKVISKAKKASSSSLISVGAQKAYSKAKSKNKGMSLKAGNYFNDSACERWIVNNARNIFSQKRVWEKFCKELVFNPIVKKWVWETFCKKWIASAWDWLNYSKAGKITWSAIWLVLSIVGLILSIIGLPTPVSPIAVASLVVSGVSAIGSLISLLMAIFS